MTTKNQNYIELPVQDAIGTPESGFVSLGFSDGKFQGKDAGGNPISFSPPSYSNTVKVHFFADDWTGSGSELKYVINPWDIPFDHTANLIVQVRDAVGNLVFGGVNINVDGTVTLTASAPYAGIACITGVITTQ